MPDDDSAEEDNAEEDEVNKISERLFNIPFQTQLEEVEIPRIGRVGRI